MNDILIIDDDPMICRMLSAKIKRLDHQVQYTHTLAEGEQMALDHAFDVIVLDVRLPDGNGIDALPKFKTIPNQPEIIIITGLGDPNGAELAMKHNVWDYIEKSSSTEAMILPLVRALEYRKEKQTIKPSKILHRQNIIGDSPKLHDCLNQLALAADSDANVLIHGETGTGKELFARAIHDNSKRASEKFIIVDCAALPDSLVENLLFGHEKGAYTGAEKSREGLIKLADQGTLFLDEIGELPMSIQKSFLRVLQEHRFRPIGSNQEIESQFRLIAATNRNLQTMIEENTFREDLYYRLRGLTVELPPLRDRRQDIKDIVLHTITNRCELYKMATKGISPDFIDTLLTYDWPGNIRELINTIDEAIARANFEPTMYPKHLPNHIRIHKARTSINPTPTSNESLEKETAYTLTLDTMKPLQDFRDEAYAKLERQYVQDLLALSKGNIKQACEVSQIGRARLYQLMKKYNLSSKPD
jgi:two-component system NtrC family response regulator